MKINLVQNPKSYSNNSEKESSLCFKKIRITLSYKTLIFFSYYINKAGIS